MLLNIVNEYYANVSPLCSRNINYGRLVVDTLHNEYPELRETFSPPGKDVEYLIDLQRT